MAKNNIKVQTESENGFDYFKNAGWYIKRTSNYEFAAKAGDNKESHNHNDIGVFLLNVGGDKIVTDPAEANIRRTISVQKDINIFRCRHWHTVCL